MLTVQSIDRGRSPQLAAPFPAIELRAALAPPFNDGATRGAGFALGAQRSDPNGASRWSLPTAVSSQLFDADFDVAAACDFGGADTAAGTFAGGGNSALARVAAN